jgi:hypothetical protein
MKKFIYWLAEVSGVADDIKREHNHYIGSLMCRYHLWWWAGTPKLKHKMPVLNAFYLYGMALKSGWYTPNIGDIRDKVYKLGNHMHPDITKDQEVEFMSGTATITLDEKYQKLLLDSLAHPPKPNDKLVKLMKDYRG